MNSTQTQIMEQLNKLPNIVDNLIKIFANYKCPCCNTEIPTELKTSIIEANAVMQHEFNNFIEVYKK